ncbi:MAG: hypothetical protein ILO42_06825 [Clostridia bacterium]|nr:hypothetical protein [Clostridia bacterium]
MQNPFKKKKDGDTDTVVVLKRTGRNMCGGTDATQDLSAPKEIGCDRMTYFSATSELGYAGGFYAEKLHFISACAIPDGGGSFLLLVTGRGYSDDPPERMLGYVKKDIFPDLVKLVNETGLAEKNGYHSRTHGLPRDFGGSVSIDYADGERISFSDNQTPVLSMETAIAIERVFLDAIAGDKAELPPLSELDYVVFRDDSENGGFEEEQLVFLPDGSADVTCFSRYDDPRIFESSKHIDAETVSGFMKKIESSLMLAWAGLPDAEYRLGAKESIRFVFKEDSGIPDINVEGKKKLPDDVGRAAFDIKLKLRY